MQLNECRQCNCFPVVYEVVPNRWRVRCLTQDYKHNHKPFICYANSREEAIQLWNQEN
jgi:hypothetical protein